MHFYHSHIYIILIQPYLLSYFRSFVPFFHFSIISPVSFIQSSKNASKHYFILSRILPQRKILFFSFHLDTNLKLEFILLFGEFHKIISPNNIFVLTQIQIFIFLKKVSCNARTSFLLIYTFYVKDWNPIDLLRSRIENRDGERCRAVTHDRAASGLTINPSPFCRLPQFLFRSTRRIHAQYISVEYASSFYFSSYRHRYKLSYKKILLLYYIH